MKMYFKGTSGIENPTDFNGKVIKEGDILTGDWFDNSDHSWMKKTEQEMQIRFHQPTYKVKSIPGKGLYADGIDRDLYLHDFRFKYCKILNQK